jgi:O-acetyl-ADP-ribose deacetylase (regulator of RNase III)
MNYLKTINGNLLDANEPYILHQCNCVSENAKALAEQIFKKYPYSNTYSKRVHGIKSTYGIPGTIDICTDTNNKTIINAYAQIYPSTAKYDDTQHKRLTWFRECLDHVRHKNINNIAMPYNIGCGAAGGDWKQYYEILETFANDNKIHITLYKL